MNEPNLIVVDGQSNQMSRNLAELNDKLVIKRLELQGIESSMNEKRNIIQKLSVELLDPNINAAQKKSIKQQHAREKLSYDNIRRSYDLCDSEINDLSVQLESIRRQEYRERAVDKTLESVAASLAYFNAHYIVNEDLWYVAYLNESDVRQSVPVVTNYKSNIFTNVIEYYTDWRPNDPRELIAIAKAADRCKLSVERTFLPSDRRVYNQMDSLRSLWLQPLADKPHSEAFDVLIATIVDDRLDYIDQLERLIAYSYCHPEDLQTPSIDSIAVGGSGRGTLWKILETIFTEECCGSANKETFSGTHNGELWGKVWVRISEQDSYSIDSEELKNLTGSKNFRLRRMGQDAVNSPRTFRFFMETNKYGGTAKYTGTGKASTERRYEPIITKLTLLEKIKQHYAVEESEAWEILQGFQDIYDDRIEIARWLNHIITKHNANGLTGVRALHGECYDMVVERQINAFDTFMNTVYDLSIDTNTYDYKELCKIYKLATGKKDLDSSRFAARAAEWLIRKSGEDWQTGTKDVYLSRGANNDERVRRQVIFRADITSKRGGPNNDKMIWDVEEFIDPDAVDPKNAFNTLGTKPCIDNIRKELL